MRGVIWYKNKDNGFAKMESIMHGYDIAGIKFKDVDFRKNKEQMSVIYENGDVWKCIPARENMKGHKSNISIVERCIDESFFHEVIMPTIIAYPYKAIDFYGEGELGYKEMKPKNNLQEFIKDYNGYAFDSLVYRFKDYQSRCYDLEVRDLMYEKNVSREEARKTIKDMHKRDLMRFIEILDDAMGEHS